MKLHWSIYLRQEARNDTHENEIERKKIKEIS